MSLLIVYLPPGPPGEYVWVRSDDGQRVHAHGAAAPALLPAAGRGVEVVAVASAQQLSWLRATLPRGLKSGSPRLRAALDGLLEDALLDEPQDVHFAVREPQQAGSGQWVAACRRDWLQAHLNALDAAGRPVARIAPELSPSDGAPGIIACGTPEAAWLYMRGHGIPGGAQALPLAPGALSVLDAATLRQMRWFAEPAVADLATQTFGSQPELLGTPERLLAASRSSWDLAQFDFARSAAARGARQLGSAWRNFWHAPLWRPARWGLALLLLANLIGLNVAAWQSNRDLAARRKALGTALTQAFPHVRVVTAMPVVQMQREVEALRQATGAPSSSGMEAMLAALATALPQGQTPTALEYEGSSLRASGTKLDASALSDAGERLRPLGYRISAEGDALLLRPEVTP
ncbi:MAG: general secretion pathway protein GspL [Ottowia sp.]|nr:general secretion pathway protein GspL [Ottowia sp.]